MPNTRRDARLIEEHRDKFGIRSELRVEPLDRDRAREPNGPDEASEVDRGHATRGDDAVQRVTPNNPNGGGRGSHAFA